MKRLEGGKPDFPLPARAFEHLRMSWKNSPLHLDDDPWPNRNEKKKWGTLKLKVRLRALIVLRPPESRKQFRGRKKGKAD